MAKFINNNTKQDSKREIRKPKNKNIITLSKMIKPTLKKVFKQKNLNVLIEDEQVQKRSKSSFKLKKKGVNDPKPNAVNLKILHEIVENYVPNNNSLIVDENNCWTSQLVIESQENKTTPLDDRRKLKEFAAYVYEHDAKLQRSNDHYSTTGNTKLRKMVLSHGTAKDVVSALASYCIDDPIHSLHELQRLINFINPKRKQTSSKPIEYLGNLFKNTYLPDGYVAKEFECHAFSSLLPYAESSPEIVVKQLLLWYFEDQIRICYLQLIENLALLSNQEISKIQAMAIANIARFIARHPKQDVEKCLQKIINKLGDKLRKIAGVSINQLRTLQSNCPEIKPLLITLIHTFLYRKGFTERNQFYGLCVLKDINLSRNDPLAEKLIAIYFEFFTNCITKGSVDNRFMSCLLRGISQALSQSGCLELLQQKLDKMYILCHLVTYNRSIQVAQLIYQTFDMTLSDRFYNLIYKMILNSDFGRTTNISSFLNLLYKAMVKDTEVARIQAFFKRLLQVCTHQPVDIVCAILIVIVQVLEENDTTKIIRETIVGDQENVETGMVDNTKQYRRTSYDPKCVDALYARADLSYLYELYILQGHYHPSVRSFLSQLFTNGTIDYSGDPFIDFSYSTFLSRFVQKKPKKLDYEGNNVYVRNKQYVPEGARNLPVTSKEFCEIAEEDIPVDELFFYKYYKSYGKARGKISVKTDIDIDDDDEFESIMRQKNYNQYVDINLKEIDFANSTVPVKGRAQDSALETDVSDELNEDTYEEESNDYSGDENELAKELDEFGYEEMEEEEENPAVNRIKKSKKKSKGKRFINSDDEMAEEFSTMLESNVNGDGFEQTTSDAVSSHIGKQNNWEKNRTIKKRKMPSKPYKNNKKGKY